MTNQEKTKQLKEILVTSYRQAYSNQTLSVKDLLHQLIEKLKPLREGNEK